MGQKIMHGARAVVQISKVDPNGNQVSKVVGIWNSFSYSVNLDVQPSFLLGRFSAAELTTTAMEPVSITAQGWRVIDHGAFVDGGFTNLTDLLNQEYLYLSIYDRKTKRLIAVIRGCIPTGLSQSATAKQLMEMSNTYVGLLVDDESGPQQEASDRADLPA